MVIAPGSGGISAFVILADGELLPENFNSPKIVAMRRGESTNWEIRIVKQFGKLADAELLRAPEAPVCNYPGDGNPLHQHADETWWFYEETWAYENGPFDTQELGHSALVAYCEGIQRQREKDLTTNQESDTVVEEGEAK